MEIAFKTNARIMSVSVAEVGKKDEEKTTAISLKIRGEVPGENLAHMIGATAGDVKKFWNSAGGSPAFPDLTDMKSDKTIEPVNVKIAGQKYTGVKMSSMSVRCLEGELLRLTATLKFTDTTDAGAGKLVKQVNHVIAVDLESQQIDAFNGDDDG